MDSNATTCEAIVNDQSQKYSFWSVWIAIYFMIFIVNQSIVTQLSSLFSALLRERAPGSLTCSLLDDRSTTEARVKTGTGHREQGRWDGQMVGVRGRGRVSWAMGAWCHWSWAESVATGGWSCCQCSAVLITMHYAVQCIDSTHHQQHVWQHIPFCIINLVLSSRNLN